MKYININLEKVYLINFIQKLYFSQIKFEFIYNYQKTQYLLN